MKNKLAFDIGCNVGNYTLKLLENDFQVVAVDPHPALFTKNNLNVTRVYSACSDKCGSIDFYFCPEDTISTADLDWINNSRFSNRKLWYKHEVPSVTIDSLVEKYGVPDHIKIDVEGYELVCLKGMSKKYSPELCFEWAEEKGDSAVECVNYLSELGYTHFGFILSDEYLKQPDHYMSLDDFLKIFNFDKNRKELWGMIWAK
jgi:FkbM family methyltransferase